MSLIFDASTHQYELDGVIIPSVTQIIQSSGLYDYSNIPESVLDAAAARGTLVHKLTEVHDRNEFMHVDSDAIELQYLDSYIKFLGDFRPEIIKVETQFASRRYRFAGTIDRVMKICGTLAVVDIKTGSKMPAHNIQLAAYQQLCNETEFRVTPVAERYGLYLTPSGYKFEKCKRSDELDLSIFLSALSIYNYKKTTCKND